MYSDYLGLNSDYTYQEYQQPAFVSSVTSVEGGTTVVTTINGGGGGQATGPTITFSGGTTGLNFSATGSTISLSGTLGIANGGTGGTTAAAARASLGAAASGVNTDITQLNGASQVDVSIRYLVSALQVLSSRKTGWTAPTGTATRTGFDTATVTLPQLAEAFKALVDDLIAHGMIGS